MELTESQHKKLQTIGKRLCQAHKGSKTPLNKYHADGDDGYFTNSHVAFKFKNAIIKEDIPVTPYPQSESYPNVSRLFEGFQRGKEVTISVKDLLKVIRKERANFKQGIWNEALNHHTDKDLVRLVVDEEAETVRIIQGREQGAYHVDFKNLYEILLMADSFKVKEMACYFHDSKSKASINTRPMLMVSEKMDALLCPVRIA